MTRSTPTKADILKWIIENPNERTKRDIVSAFGMKGAARVKLKHILRELKEEGALPGRGRERGSNELPPIGVLDIRACDPNGDLFATPAGRDVPRILLRTPPDTDTPKTGDRVLAKIIKTPQGDTPYEGRLIRVLPAQKGISGVFYPTKTGGEIRSTDKREKQTWPVAPSGLGGAKEGDIVHAEPTGKTMRAEATGKAMRSKATGKRHAAGVKEVRITEITGSIGQDKNLAQIAIESYGLQNSFTKAVLSEAMSAKLENLAGYSDLSALPFVTIDPADARDHDDAVFAQPDPDHPEGHIIWVAIADVAAFVPVDTALDEEAQARGNSVYFPNQVIPMLPETLSNELCSLHENETRPVIAVCINIGADGIPTAHEFSRALIRVRAALSYDEAQDAQNGHPNARTAPLMQDVIAPLFAAFEATSAARTARAPLELDLPERKISLDENGGVKDISLHNRLNAHCLIEDFMILANVAAAETLKTHKIPLIFRVHESPDDNRLEGLQNAAKSLGLKFTRGEKPAPRQLNQLLRKAAGTEQAEAVNLSVLRSQAQAIYSTTNNGHFGLALRNYTHFTSPIRRYADLTIHRALIAAHSWDQNTAEFTDENLANQNLAKIAAHITLSERRAMAAERETHERYIAVFLRERVGERFQARISGVAGFGIFVKLDETGGEGLIPISVLGNEYFNFDANAQNLVGRDSGAILALGARVEVRLENCDPLTGGLLFRLLTLEGKALPRSKNRPRRTYQKREQRRA